jgi:hypothetical protein
MRTNVSKKSWLLFEALRPRVRPPWPPPITSSESAWPKPVSPMSIDSKRVSVLIEYCIASSSVVMARSSRNSFVITFTCVATSRSCVLRRLPASVSVAS